MQVFSSRVLRGPEPDSTRTWSFLNTRNAIPVKYMIFHTRSTPKYCYYLLWKNVKKTLIMSVHAVYVYVGL